MAENAFRVVLPRLVKAIHVELSDKAVHLPVSEVMRQNNILKFVHILNDEVFS